MPQVGSMYVPDKFFERLAAEYATDFTEEIFETAQVQLDMDLRDRCALTRLDHSSANQVFDCLRAFVRMEIGDYTSPDSIIERNAIYKTIEKAAMHLGKSIAYQALAEDSQLKSLVKSNVPMVSSHRSV